MNGGWYVNSVFGCICDCSAGSDGFVANCDVTVALSCIWIWSHNGIDFGYAPERRRDSATSGCRFGDIPIAVPNRADLIIISFAVPIVRSYSHATTHPFIASHRIVSHRFVAGYYYRTVRASSPLAPYRPPHVPHRTAQLTINRRARKATIRKSFPPPPHSTSSLPSTYPFMSPHSLRANFIPPSVHTHHALICNSFHSLPFTDMLVVTCPFTAHFLSLVNTRQQSGCWGAHARQFGSTVLTACRCGWFVQTVACTHHPLLRPDFIPTPLTLITAPHRAINCTRLSAGGRC